MAKRTSARAVVYGTSPGCDVRGLELEGRGLEGIAFTLECAGHSTRVQTHLPGRHLLTNALAAAAAGLVEGIALDEIASALARVQVPLRLTVHRARCGATILDDTYNASPSSMMAALDLLAELPGRRIAVLGDMRELGAMEEQGHRSVGQRAAEVADLIYAVGGLGRLTGGRPRAGHNAGASGTRKRQPRICEAPEPTDVVLLKARGPWPWRRCSQCWWSDMVYALVVGSAAFVVSLAAGGPVVALLRRLRLGKAISADGPASHAVKAGTPTMGGLLIFGVVFLVTAPTNLSGHGSIFLPLGAIVAAGLLGLFDDYLTIEGRERVEAVQRPHAPQARDVDRSGADGCSCPLLRPRGPQHQRAPLWQVRHRTLLHSYCGGRPRRHHQCRGRH
jgi:hypothetical protein